MLVYLVTILTHDSKKNLPSLSVESFNIGLKERLPKWKYVKSTSWSHEGSSFNLGLLKRNLGLDQTLPKLNFINIQFGFSEVKLSQSYVLPCYSKLSGLNTVFPSYILLKVPTQDKLQVTLCRLYFARLHFAHKKRDREIKYKTLSL